MRLSSTSVFQRKAWGAGSRCSSPPRQHGVQRVGTPQEGHDAATYSSRRLLTWSTFMVQIDCPLPFVDVSYCAHGAAASIAAAIWFRISILRLLQPAVGSWLSTGAQAQKQQFYIIDLMHIFRFHLSAALQCITTPPCFVSAPSCAERQP